MKFLLYPSLPADIRHSITQWFMLNENHSRLSGGESPIVQNYPTYYPIEHIRIHPHLPGARILFSTVTTTRCSDMSGKVSFVSATSRWRVVNLYPFLDPSHGPKPRGCLDTSPILKQKLRRNADPVKDKPLRCNCSDVSYPVCRAVRLLTICKLKSCRRFFEP